MNHHAVTIWDLDNCLADDSWRLPYILWSEEDLDRRFHPYHIRSFADRAHNTNLFRVVAMTTEPIFITSRPDAFRTATVNWVEQVLGIVRPQIIMRDHGDRRGSAELKREAARALMKLRPVHGAFDDREDVLLAYRELGIVAARLWIHDTDLEAARTAPRRPVLTLKAKA